MGKFTEIFIVSDYDGTFTSHIPENYRKNIEAVERFKKGGGIFTFATGRDYLSLLSIEPAFESIINAPVIIANGARLYDANKKDYIFNYTMNLTLFSEFLEIISEEYPEIGIRFSCENGMVALNLNEILKNDLDDIFMRTMSVREMSMRELLKSGEKAYKCVMVHNPETLDLVIGIAEKFNAAKNREFLFSKSYPRGLEAVNSKSSKGETALKLKEYLSAGNGRNYKLFAIGDYDNDLSMIKLADYGAAPGNALEHVKKASGIITVNCDGGAIADLIGIIEREYL